jgi:non-reducing end alpha-L-arabinofuranosidase
MALLSVAGSLAGSGTSQAAGSLPCDIYGAAGTPCVAAHSTVRALFASYDGPLYQVQRASDKTTLDIGVTETGGTANAGQQDAFCAGTTCTITKVYDQSPQRNDLTIEGAGGNGAADVGAIANALPMTVGGQKVYGLNIGPGMGYRDDTTTGVAVNGQPEGMYMVTSGTHVNNRCCFDYGNAETNNLDNGNGHMDAVNFSTFCVFQPCPGTGPWVQADLENGLFQSDQGVSADPSNTGNTSPFVTALIKNNGQDHLALKSGNAQTGSLTTNFSGPEPSLSDGYSPMHQEGGIVLGTGGDNTNVSVGSFFEGVMTAGIPTDAADDAVQANIVSAGYADPIADYYSSAGGANSFLGQPTGPETSVAGGRVQPYQGGTLFYSPATGTHVVMGAILAKYNAMGGPAGSLGFPTSDEQGTPDGAARFNTFAGTGGSALYWTADAGAHSIQGSIYQHFLTDGGEAAMGAPTTDETGTPDGIGRFNHFTNDASIYWTPSTGAQWVHGAIRDKWSSLGWERSQLGYPTSDEFAVSGGRQNTFQHGTITWFSKTNTTQATVS